MAAASDLVGKLTRVYAMLTDAASKEAAQGAAKVLVATYNDLLGQLKETLAGDERVAELNRFNSLPDPPAFSANAPETIIAAEEAASTAHVQLGQLASWVKGLIDAETLVMKMRLEAEAKAERQARPPIGFGTNP